MATNDLNEEKITHILSLVEAIDESARELNKLLQRASALGVATNVHVTEHHTIDCNDPVPSVYVGKHLKI